jgi:hypothetical protein
MANVTPGYQWTSGEVVTPAKMNSAATPTVALADNEVTSAKILNDAVTNVKLASDLDASKLTAGTLPAARIGAGAINASRLASDAVETTKILNGAVTVAKLSTGAVGTGVGFIRQVTSSYATMQGPDGTKTAYAWGTSGASSTSAYSNITFPVTFSAAPAVTATVNDVAFGIIRYVSTGAVSTTNFQYQVRNQNNNAQNDTIQWIAIGPVA